MMETPTNISTKNQENNYEIFQETSTKKAENPSAKLSRWT
jgi:hypothetical protein